MIGAGGIGTILRDCRYAFRLLRRSPVFATVAVVTLVFGIAANSAMFSIIESILIHELPFRNSHRVFQLMRELPGGRQDDSVSIPDYLDLRQQDQSFSRLAIVDCCFPKLVGSNGEPQRVVAGKISADLLPALGFEPLLGRGFTDDDAQPGHDHVVILTYDFWRENFSGNTGVVGSSVMIDGMTFKVIGVLRPRFLLMPSADVLVPFVIQEAPFRKSRSAPNFDVYAELRSNMSLRQAITETKTVAARLREEYPDADKDQDYSLVGLHEALVGQVRPALLLLMAAVGLVLMVACANISIMLLSQIEGRHREFAVRFALGASRGRIFQQMLSESVLIALLGCALSLLITPAILRLLSLMEPQSLPMSSEIRINLPVLLFTIIISFFAAVIFGSGPALRAGVGYLSSSLSVQKPVSSHKSGTRAALVITETSLAVILTVVAGLVLKTIVSLSIQNPGYATKGVITFGISLDPSHRSVRTAVSLLREIEAKLSQAPGVQASGACSNLPMERGGDIFFTIVGQPAPMDRSNAPHALWRYVTPGYFRALGLHLMQGRWFSDFDDTDSEPVVIVNEALVDKHFTERNGLGQHLYIGAPFAPGIHDIGTRTIIGIVGAARTVSLSQPDEPTIYIPLSQLPPTIASQIGAVNMVVRGGGDGLKNSIRKSLQSVDPGLSIWHIRGLDQLLSEYLAPVRFTVVLLGTFAGLATVLAAIGIYGVLAYSVEQRRAEIGVRMALGARPHNIILMIVGEGTRLTLIGIGIGLALCLPVARFVQSLVYGISATDPLVFLAVGTIFIFVAFMAGVLPAMRATHIDPASSLRGE